MKVLKPVLHDALDSAGQWIDAAMLVAAPFIHQPGSLIFTFHSVGQPGGGPRDDGERADHSYEVFAGFLQWLKTHAEVVPLSQLVHVPGSGSHAPRGNILAALSFDDAHLDHYTTIYPLLKSLQLPGTFFVPSGLLGRSHGMTPSMVREVAAAGITIGSHSVTHRPLTSLSRREMETELCDSKAALEDLTGLECRELAYPYGLYDEATTAIAESAGYFCAAGASLNEPPGVRFALPRTTIPNRNSDWSYRIALQDVNVWRRRLRRIPWLVDLIQNQMGYKIVRAQAPVSTIIGAPPQGRRAANTTDALAHF